MPACELKVLVISGFSSAMSSLSLTTFPTSLNAKTSFFLLPSIARPAESCGHTVRIQIPHHTAQVVWREPYIASIFQPGQAIDERVENVLAVSLDQVVDVSENPTVIGT